MARLNWKRMNILPDFLQNLRFCKIDTCMYFNKYDSFNPTKYPDWHDYVIAGL